MKYAKMVGGETSWLSVSIDCSRSRRSMYVQIGYHEADY